MNNDLKKVGLVFNADGTTDFINSLKNVNQNLRENYNQFKITQAQWDSSTSSTEKLKSKLDYLNNAYSIQEQKVKVLRTELNELQNAEEKDEKAIQKKEKALIQAEIQLQKYSTQIRDTESKLSSLVSKTENLTKSLDIVGGAVTKTGQKLSVLSGIAGTAFVASAKSAIDFESAFAGVEKTVDGTYDQLQNLKQGIRDMSKELPASTTEIAAVAEAAGQLGIATDDILDFTKVMIDLGESTNLSADEAASSLAKFANIMNTSADNYSRLGATIVDLGNNFATTEADIVEMAMRIAGAGKTIGLTESEVLSLATALSSVGIEAEMGGSAISKAMIKMAAAVETENDQLKEFAKVAGMTTKEFKKCFENNAIDALSKFIVGLGNTESAGKSTLLMLEDLGFSEVRLRDTMLRAANASTLFNKAINTGNEAWNENSALINEANKRYKTLKSQLDITKNKLADNAITIGNKLMPTIEKIVEKIGIWTNKISELDDEQVETIVKIGAFVVASGPLLTILGKITTTTSGVIKGIATFSDALKVTQGTMTSTNTAVNNLANIIGGLKSPLGIAVTSITLFTGAMALISKVSNQANTEVANDFKAIGESAQEFVKGVNDATSELNSFSDNLFISSEEQMQLSQNMQTAQDGITEIVNLASQERRSYTQQEIQKLNEYFQTMHEISQKELEVQQQKSQTIVQMYSSELSSYQGSLEGYQTLSQQKIKTIEEQRDYELQMIEESTIEQLALLNQRYGDQANMQNEAYANEYNKIIKQKELNIAQANEQVSALYQIITQGYADRINADDEFYKQMQTANNSIEEENQRHAQKLEEIENNKNLTQMDKNTQIMQETAKHESALRTIWNNMYKNLDEASANELGVLISLASNTELYGGKVDEKTKEMVDSIVETYNKMPSKTRDAMKNAMTPMLEEMEKKEPSLFSKATNIANGILGRLKKAFDIHSPSRKTRSIFKNVMLGAEKGIEEEEKNLYKQTDNLSKNILSDFENIDKDFDFNKNNMVETSLSNQSQNMNPYNVEIDYMKMYTLFLQALNNCKISLDDDGFIRLIDEHLREVL